SFRGGIYRSTADGATMSTTNLAENAAPTAALPACPLAPASKREEDTESAGGVRPPRTSPCQNFLRHNKLTAATIAAVVAGITLGVLLRPLGESTMNALTRNCNSQSLKGGALATTNLSTLPVGGSSLSLSTHNTLAIIWRHKVNSAYERLVGLVIPARRSCNRDHYCCDTTVTSSPRPRKMILVLSTLITPEGIGNAFPPNVIEACVTQFSTIVLRPKGNDSNSSMYEWDFKTVSDPGTNILGLIVFCIALGATIGKMGDSGRPLLDMFTSLSDAMMIITKLVVWFSPVGVMFLVMAKMLAMEDFTVVAGMVGMYSLTVLLGLFIHGFIVLPLIYTIVLRTSPLRFLMDMMQAIFTAFGTASSSATLPVTIAILEEKVKVNPKVVRFCIPIGATINMDGTALYEAVAAIFIAQVRKVPLDIGKVIAISVTATAASIGAAGIPQAGLVTMVMVLNAVGLPADDITLIIVVDWILDRFRTAINVLGDAVGACVVERLSLEDLKPQASAVLGSKDTVMTAM
ncbi:unnamed protein product, partial [Ixodes hexagonus]